MCTAVVVPVRKGTVPTSCGIPSLITRNEIIPGTYIHGIYVRTYNTYTRKRRLRSLGEKERNRKSEKRNRNETETNMRPGRRPSPDGPELL